MHDVKSAGGYSWVSGALAFWGLFCTVTLQLFFTVPVLVVFSALGGCAQDCLFSGDWAGLLLLFYELVYLHIYCLLGSARHLLAKSLHC